MVFWLSHYPGWELCSGWNDPRQVVSSLKVHFLVYKEQDLVLVLILFLTCCLVWALSSLGLVLSLTPVLTREAPTPLGVPKIPGKNKDFVKSCSREQVKGMSHLVKINIQFLGVVALLYSLLLRLNL